MFSATVPSNSTTSWGSQPRWRASAASPYWSISAPASVTLPDSAGHTPVSARASVDLPDAEGPAMPTAEPGCSAKEAPRTAGRCAPGAPT